MKLIKKISYHFNSLEEVILFLKIFLLATVLPLLVKLLTVPHLMKVLTPHSSKLDSKLETDEIRNRIETYTLYILSRDFWIYRNTCMKRTLILYHFLRRYGMYVTACFGVRYKGEQLGNLEGSTIEGHAWLLCKGDIILEKNMEETKTYKMTYCYPEVTPEVVDDGFMTEYEGLK